MLLNLVFIDLIYATLIQLDIFICVISILKILVFGKDLRFESIFSLIA